MKLQPIAIGFCAAVTLAGGSAGAQAIQTEGTAPTVRLPVWRQRPEEEDVARYFPSQAAQAGVPRGSARVDCVVADDGRLSDCKVGAEAPAGYGFGDAALKLARHFQMAPNDADGHPTAGGTVAIPFSIASPR